MTSILVDAYGSAHNLLRVLLYTCHPKGNSLKQASRDEFVICFYDASIQN
jgi:hypothetical protein